MGSEHTDISTRTWTWTWTRMMMIFTTKPPDRPTTSIPGNHLKHLPSFFLHSFVRSFVFPLLLLLLLPLLHHRIFLPNSQLTSHNSLPTTHFTQVTVTNPRHQLGTHSQRSKNITRLIGSTLPFQLLSRSRRDLPSQRYAFYVNFTSRHCFASHTRHTVYLPSRHRNRH
jgi:hypothetical protein